MWEVDVLAGVSRSLIVGAIVVGDPSLGDDLWA